MMSFQDKLKDEKPSLGVWISESSILIHNIIAHCIYTFLNFEGLNMETFQDTILKGIVSKTIFIKGPKLKKLLT